MKFTRQNGTYPSHYKSSFQSNKKKSNKIDTNKYNSKSQGKALRQLQFLEQFLSFSHSQLPASVRNKPRFVDIYKFRAKSHGKTILPSLPARKFYIRHKVHEAADSSKGKRALSYLPLYLMRGVAKR